MSVNVIKNFISEDDAKFVVDNFDKNLCAVDHRAGFYEDLNKRWPAPFDESSLDTLNRFETYEENMASAMINSFIYLCKEELERFYKTKLNNFVGGMTKLTKEADLGLHADMYNLDGTRREGDKKATSLRYSALIYLSSMGKDFFGGSLEFPLQNIVIEPTVGALVFFEGDAEHPHLVNRITSGNRYSIVMFFG